jgi:hypothetical protein
MDRLRSRHREVNDVQIDPMIKPGAWHSVHGVDALRFSFDRVDIDLLSKVIIASRWLALGVGE